MTCPRKGTDDGLGHTGYLATSDCNGKMFIPPTGWWAVGHKLFDFIFIYTHKTWKHRPETEAIHPSDSCTLSWNQHISAPFTFVGEFHQFLFCVTLFIATVWWVVCKSLQTICNIFHVTWKNLLVTKPITNRFSVQYSLPLCNQFHATDNQQPPATTHNRSETAHFSLLLIDTRHLPTDL